MKSQNIKICGKKIKQCLGGNFQYQMPDIGNEERSQMSDLSFHFKKLKEQIKLKVSRRKEIIKNSNTNQWIRKQKRNRKKLIQPKIFLRSIKLINLAILIRKKRERRLLLFTEISSSVQKSYRIYKKSTRISKFSKVAGYKVNLKSKSYFHKLVMRK